MSFITLEENRMFTFRRDPENLAMVAGCHIEVTALVKGQVPDIFRARLEIDR